MFSAMIKGWPIPWLMDGSLLALTNHTIVSGQIIATSTEVALNDQIRKGIPPNPLNSGLGMMVGCLE